jgi:hypothetical protein
VGSTEGTRRNRCLAWRTQDMPSTQCTPGLCLSNALRTSEDPVSCGSPYSTIAEFRDSRRSSLDAMKKASSLRGLLAKNLKVALVRKRMAVVAAADFAEVSPAHLYDILGARKAATVDVIEKLAAALGAEPASLLVDNVGMGPAAPSRKTRRQESPISTGTKRRPRPRAGSSRP